ncbi:MAG: NAD-dependent epimerase/dehydratase family protein [Actinomycetota bacterium]|nr:NAD-dependent epimerase/dehydratase family protein [Actinomycetota bacterium]
MRDTVLITGGAGFIGSHLAAELLQSGYAVRALDNLTPQVHETPGRPAYLHPDVELLIGDLRDPRAVRDALEGVDAVVHLAARVGVGQSMYEIAEYTSANALATAVLLEALLDHPVGRLVVASSMSVYGEGLYADAAGRPVHAAERTRGQLERGEWEPRDAEGGPLAPRPTPEDKQPSLSSIYALGKFDQERMCLLFGDAYRVPTVALRFFNVYGPHQALSNPYTGVLAIFAGRLLNGRPPLIFEDGHQRRDFVSVHDVVRACRLALERPSAAGRVLNVGSGESVSVREIATRLGAVLGRERVEPRVTGKYRVGDIRHCFADVTIAADVLGYVPAVSLEEGVSELAGWLEGQVAIDRVDGAAAELAARGLTV